MPSAALDPELTRRNGYNHGVDRLLSSDAYSYGRPLGVMSGPGYLYKPSRAHDYLTPQGASIDERVQVDVASGNTAVIRVQQPAKVRQAPRRRPSTAVSLANYDRDRIRGRRGRRGDEVSPKGFNDHASSSTRLSQALPDDSSADELAVKTGMPAPRSRDESQQSNLPAPPSSTHPGDSQSMPSCRTAFTVVESVTDDESTGELGSSHNIGESSSKSRERLDALIHRDIMARNAELKELERATKIR